MKPYTLCLTFVYSLLVACSTANNVNVIACPDTLVPLNQHGEHSGRYHNLYPGKKSYPISCENDCYHAHINVLCETEGEQCQYQEK